MPDYNGGLKALGIDFSVAKEFLTRLSISMAEAVIEIPSSIFDRNFDVLNKCPKFIASNVVHVCLKKLRFLDQPSHFSLTLKKFLRVVYFWQFSMKSKKLVIFCCFLYNMFLSMSAF